MRHRLHADSRVLRCVERAEAVELGRVKVDLRLRFRLTIIASIVQLQLLGTHMLRRYSIITKVIVTLGLEQQRLRVTRLRVITSR